MLQQTSNQHDTRYMILHHRLMAMVQNHISGVMLITGLLPRQYSLKPTHETRKKKHGEGSRLQKLHWTMYLFYARNIKKLPKDKQAWLPCGVEQQSFYLTIPQAFRHKLIPFDLVFTLHCSREERLRVQQEVSHDPYS
jgi:hypothetical protein